MVTAMVTFTGTATLSLPNGTKPFSSPLMQPISTRTAFVARDHTVGDVSTQSMSATPSSNVADWLQSTNPMRTAFSGCPPARARMSPSRRPLSTTAAAGPVSIAGLPTRITDSNSRLATMNCLTASLLSLPVATVAAVIGAFAAALTNENGRLGGFVGFVLELWKMFVGFVANRFGAALVPDLNRFDGEPLELLEKRPVPLAGVWGLNRFDVGAWNLNRSGEAALSFVEKIEFVAAAVCGLKRFAPAEDGLLNRFLPLSAGPLFLVKTNGEADDLSLEKIFFAVVNGFGLWAASLSSSE